MLSKKFSFIIFYHFLLFIVLCYIQPILAARKLEDISPSSFTGNYEPPAPTPVNNVGYNGKTVGGHVHVHTVTVNNETRSKSEIITGENGKPSIVSAKNHGARAEVIYGSNGKPEVKEAETNSSRTEIINGIDGKPQMEVQKFDNGTSIITMFGEDGKPLFHKITYKASQGNGANSFWTAPPGFPTPPPS